MQVKRLILALVLVGALGVLVLVGVSALSGAKVLASSYSQQRWEYLIVTPGKVHWCGESPFFNNCAPGTAKADVSAATGFQGESVKLEQQLSKLGEQGWELVTVVGMIGGDQEFIFKRPVR